MTGQQKRARSLGERWDEFLEAFTNRERSRWPRQWIFAFEIEQLDSGRGRETIYTELGRAIAAEELRARWLPPRFELLKAAAEATGTSPSTEINRTKISVLARLCSPTASASEAFAHPEFHERIINALVFRVDAVRRWRLNNGRPDLPPKYWHVVPPQLAAPPAAVATSKGNARVKAPARSSCKSPEEDPVLKNRIHKVLAAAERWCKAFRDGKPMPPLARLAEELAKNRDLEFSVSAIRQILSGNYGPAKKLRIGPFVWPKPK
jgi:hypothetical protein